MESITFRNVKNIYSTAALYLGLVILLSGGISKHMRLGMASLIATNSKCQNNVTEATEVANQLEELWSFCQHAGGSATGQSPDPLMAKICQSTKFNIDILCNTSIPEEIQTNVVDIWASHVIQSNICADLQKYIYIYDDNCESVKDVEGCAVNNEVVDIIDREDHDTCNGICADGGKFSPCANLLKTWKSLSKISDSQDKYHSVDSNAKENMAGTNQNQVKRTSNRILDPNNTRYLYSNKGQNKMPLLNARGNGIDFPVKGQHGAIANAEASNHRDIQGYNADSPNFPPRANAGGFMNKLLGPKYVMSAANNIPLGQKKQGIALNQEKNNAIGGLSLNDTNMLQNDRLVPDVNPAQPLTGADDRPILDANSAHALTDGIKESVKQQQDENTGLSPDNTKSNDTVLKQGSKSTPVTNIAVDNLEQKSQIRNDENKPQQQDTGDKDDPSSMNKECCFQFGWGARMTPCCLIKISCDEHDKLMAENQGAKHMPGGGWGKADVCPKDAAEAHKLWEETNKQLKTDTQQSEDNQPKDKGNSPNEDTLQGQNNEQENFPGEEDTDHISKPDSKNEENNKQDLQDPNDNGNIVEPRQQLVDDHMEANKEEPVSSNFLSYFFVMALVTVCVYLICHNKKKLIALLLEGRRGRNNGRRSRSGSRSGGRSSAQYRKLDNNLEEAMGPSSQTTFSQVIY